MISSDKNYIQILIIHVELLIVNLVFMYIYTWLFPDSKIYPKLK